LLKIYQLAAHRFHLIVLGDISSKYNKEAL